jgi:hypothetical protein
MNGSSVTFEDGSITTIEGKGNVEFLVYLFFIMFCLWLALELTC